jgi:hypothetical protein
MTSLPLRRRDFPSVDEPPLHRLVSPSVYESVPPQKSLALYRRVSPSVDEPPPP